MKANVPDGTELTREEMIEALLRRIAAYTVVLKRQLKEEDFKPLRTLRLFLKAVGRLMAEIGHQDEQKLILVAYQKIQNSGAEAWCKAEATLLSAARSASKAVPYQPEMLETSGPCALNVQVSARMSSEREPCLAAAG